MAVYIRCDGGCGKESPDANGLHIANKWTEVSTHVGTYFKTKREFTVCEECIASKPVSEFLGG